MFKNHFFQILGRTWFEDSLYPTASLNGYNMKDQFPKGKIIEYDGIGAYVHVDRIVNNHLMNDLNKNHWRYTLGPAFSVR